MRTLHVYKICSALVFGQKLTACPVSVFGETEAGQSGSSEEKIQSVSPSVGDNSRLWMWIPADVDKRHRAGCAGVVDELLPYYYHNRKRKARKRR